MKNKSALTFHVLLLVCSLSLISVENVTAQDKNIFELTISNSLSKSNAIEKSSNSKKTNKNNRNHFYNLALKLHPTVYINNNAIKKTTENKKPRKIVCKGVANFSRLENTLTKYNNVEILIIKLNTPNELNTILDLSENDAKSDLKYIYIKSNFKCTETQIKNFIKLNPESNVRVFYKTELRS